MKLADVMDKVEVGMKMVVRSEYNPEYEVFGGKVVEKKGVYLCLEVDGILHGEIRDQSVPPGSVFYGQPGTVCKRKL